MLVKGAPGVFDNVLFRVMTDGLMGTKPYLHVMIYISY